MARFHTFTFILCETPKAVKKKASAITLGWSPSLSAKVVQNLHCKQELNPLVTVVNLILSSGVLTPPLPRPVSVVLMEKALR